MDTHGAQGAEQRVEADTILHRKQGLKEKERARAEGVGQDSKKINRHCGQQRRDGRVCAGEVRGGEGTNGRRVPWRHSVSTSKAIRVRSGGDRRGRFAGMSFEARAKFKCSSWSHSMVK
eukprot:2481327-Pleurochrysis_carterae.AAC.2